MSKYPESTFTEEAILADENCGLPLYKVDEIFADAEFNCREQVIDPMSVISLSKNVAKNGLQVPIRIRPCGEFESDPKGYKWVIVSGHRRHRAYQVAKQPVIPAILDQGLTYMQYKTRNAIENIERKDLNLLEEALTVKCYKDAGWTRDDVVDELNVSHGWVQVRYMILDLPKEIQREIAAGVFNQSQIRDLYSLKKNPDEQIKAARKLKEARERGDSKGAAEVLKKAPRASSKKTRSKQEIIDMIEQAHKALGKYSITTRLLGWAAGTVSNLEIYQELRNEAQERGIDYVIPELDMR